MARIDDVRSYRAEDRAAARALLGDARAIDTPQNRVVVHESGPAGGIALWMKPDVGDLAELGAVRVPAGAPASRMYLLIAVCAEQAIAAGFTRGRFRLIDAPLLRMLQATFKIEAEPAGWDPVTGEPVAWMVQVELADARAQLEAVL